MQEMSYDWDPHSDLHVFGGSATTGGGSVLLLVVGVTARVLMTHETESEPSISSVQRGSTGASPGAGGEEEMTDLSLVHHEDEIHRLKSELLLILALLVLERTGASPGGEGEEEMTDQDEIHRLKVELAAKVREAEELQSNRRVDKAQIDRLKAEMNRLKKENASMAEEYRRAERDSLIPGQTA